MALEKRQNEHLEKQKQLEKQRKQKEDLDRRLNGASSEVSTSDEQKDLSKKRGMFTANLLQKHLLNLPQIAPIHLNLRIPI